MAREELAPKDARFEPIVRMLAASVNTRILHYLVETRRKDAPEGWRYLTEIAEGVKESPGTVSLAIQKLLPLLEEKREKGRRYFRARVRLHLVLEPFSA